MTIYEEYENALKHFKALDEADPESSVSPHRRRAITAIIKHIPVEPVNNHCPYCGSRFMLKTPHCSQCGQAMK